MNLLQETLSALEYHHLTPDDVIWVGDYRGHHAITWPEFITVGDVEYDNGYGSQKIASDLVVVGNGWWLERSEYDGAEGWEFKQQPVLQPFAKEFDRVCNVCSLGHITTSWEILDEILEEGAE